MSKPAKQGSDPTDAEVVDEKNEAPDPQRGGVQVDLEEKDEKGAMGTAAAGAGKDGAPATTADRAVEERRLKALESQVAATRRINDDLRKQLTSLNERLVAPKPESGAAVLPKGTAQETVDKYDQLVAENKWQDAVRLLAREEYKAARDVEQAEEQVRSTEERRLRTLERSKQMVEQLYPNLSRKTGDPASPESLLFDEAVDQLSSEDDQFGFDPYAPELAMHRMERIAWERNLMLTRSETVSKSPARSFGRAGQTSMPASRGSGGASTYTLNRDQKEWCDANLGHLPEAERYKHYARFAKMSEAGGVEA